MSILDDLWARGDREGVFQRCLGLMYESPVLFGGPDGLRKPFLREAVRAWDAGELLAKGKSPRPLENALLFRLRDLYVEWASKLDIAPPDPGEDTLQVSGVLDDAQPLHSALLRLVQCGSRFLSGEEVTALARAADKPVREVLWGLAKGEATRRQANPEREKAMDRFVLARRAGRKAEEFAPWAVVAREGLAILPSAIDAAAQWPAGTASVKLAEARTAVLGRLLQGKPVYEPESGAPGFVQLSRFEDDDLPAEEADRVAAAVESSIPATKALGRIARLAALVSDATTGSWEPAPVPGAGALAAADLAGWSAGGRNDLEEAVLSSPAELARAVDVLRALAGREGRTLPPVPADAVPERAVPAAPEAAPVEAPPTIRLRGWPGHLEIAGTPEGVRVEEDGHVKAFAWKAGEREVFADISSSGGGLGVRVRVRAGGAPAGGVPCVILGGASRKNFSTRPTDSTGEVVVRGMPLQSFRITVDRSPVDLVFEG